MGRLLVTPQEYVGLPKHDRSGLIAPQATIPFQSSKADWSAWAGAVNVIEMDTGDTWWQPHSVHHMFDYPEVGMNIVRSTGLASFYDRLDEKNFRRVATKDTGINGNVRSGFHIGSVPAYRTMMQHRFDGRYIWIGKSFWTSSNNTWNDISYPSWDLGVGYTTRNWDVFWQGPGRGFVWGWTHNGTNCYMGAVGFDAASPTALTTGGISMSGVNWQLANTTWWPWLARAYPVDITRFVVLMNDGNTTTGKSITPWQTFGSITQPVAGLNTKIHNFPSSYHGYSTLGYMGANRLAMAEQLDSWTGNAVAGIRYRLLYLDALNITQVFEGSPQDFQNRGSIAIAPISPDEFISFEQEYTGQMRIFARYVRLGSNGFVFGNAIQIDRSRLKYNAQFHYKCNAHAKLVAPNVVAMSFWDSDGPTYSGKSWMYLLYL